MTFLSGNVWFLLYYSLWQQWKMIKIHFPFRQSTLKPLCEVCNNRIYGPRRVCPFIWWQELIYQKTKKKEERIALSHLSRAHCSAICFHGLEGKTHTLKNKRESSPNEFERELYKTGITGCFFDHNFNKWHHNMTETSYFLETSPSIDSQENLLDGPVWSQLYHFK